MQVRLLDDPDLAVLRILFDAYFPEPPEGFFSSSYLNDFALKKKISGDIVAILQPRLEAVFKEVRCFGSAFLSKTAGHRSELPLHQVDESEHIAVNVWTPLTDSRAENGSLQVLPRSHDFAQVRRAPTLPFFWQPHQEMVRDYLWTLDVKAGEAVILNQALVHASPANATDHVRPAITTGLISADAPMEFYYQTAPGELDVYRMEDDFLLRWEDFHSAIFQRPTFGEVVRSEQYAHPERSQAQFRTFLEGVRRPEPVAPSFFRKIWNRCRGTSIDA